MSSSGLSLSASSSSDFPFFREPVATFPFPFPFAFSIYFGLDTARSFAGGEGGTREGAAGSDEGTRDWDDCEIVEEVVAPEDLVGKLATGLDMRGATLTALRESVRDLILPCRSQSASSSSETGESALDLGCVLDEATCDNASFDWVRAKVRFTASGSAEASAKSGRYALDPAGCFTGESSKKGSSSSSSLARVPRPDASLSSLSFKVECFPNASVDCDATRILFSFTGDGDTGSPRSRLRARDAAVFSGTGFEEAARSWDSIDGMGESDSGDGSLCGRTRGCDFPLLGVANGLAREKEGERDGDGGDTSRCFPLLLTGEKGLEVEVEVEVFTARDLSNMEVGLDLAAESGADCLALLRRL